MAKNRNSLSRIVLLAGYAINPDTQRRWIAHCNNLLFLILWVTQVTYFKQKRVADFNKNQQLKKLEAEGAVPMSQANEKSKWKPW